MIKLTDEIDLSKAGICLLVYGPTNSGKTMSALTADDPILHVNTEGKDARLVHGQIKHSKKVSYVRFESFDDAKASLNDFHNQCLEQKFPFKTVFFDGLTFQQQAIKHELEESRRGAREEEKDFRGIIDYFRFERPDWGAMGSAMSTITDLLMRLSSYGITVICTALEDNNYPKWGQGVRIGPSFVGQDYSKLLPGFFHFIGYVIRPFQFDTEGKPVFPLVSFNSSTDPSGNDYIARSSSTVLSSKGPAPLDYSKILKVIRGTK